jgi:hypothetical protein
MRVVGTALAEALLRPFRHLLGPPSGEPPQLVVELWDEAETGVSCDLADPRLVPTGQTTTVASHDGRWVVYLHGQTLTCLDRRARHLVGWIRDTASLGLYELGRPLHAPLLLWHRDRGIHAVHAGLVSEDGRGVLFAGEGGSGKTTSALACLFAGFQYLSDDYVGLERRGDGTYVGHSLYASSHLEPGHLRRFPELVPHAIRGHLPHEDKSLVLLSDLFPDRFARSTPIDLLLLPRVTGGPEPIARPATKGQALLRLAPSSLLMLPHATGAAFGRLADLVDRVPRYWLELGGDVHAIPPRVRELLARIRP